MHLFKRSLLYIILFISIHIQAQKLDSLINLKRENNFFGVPLLFYTPETKLGFGISAINTLKYIDTTLHFKPSQFQLGFAYTLNKQLLIYLPFRYYTKQDRFVLYGEVGYYKYNYNFYGIGNLIPDNFVENYSVNYPRLRINALKKITPKIYLGVKYAFDKNKIISLDTSGVLIKNTILGSEGGIISGAGIALNYDSRDNINYPSEGMLIDVSFSNFSSYIGSQYEYTRFTIDISKYFLLKWNHTLALNIFSDFATGNIPFYQMPMLGGTKRLRGYYEGKYRDKNAFVLQTEYRMPLFWKFGLHIFGSYGGIADTINNLNLHYFKFAGGLGLRLKIDESTKTNIRFDYGFGNNSSGFYVTFGEAF